MENTFTLDIMTEILGLLFLAALVGVYVGYKVTDWAIMNVFELGILDATALSIFALMILRALLVFRVVD